ncbi:MAG: hypothetical protein HYY87_03410, partial [Candidatus Levybacteria bacterium]|nr:hypothetical protein [Candidatus Levybacteria bacterium]
MRFPALAPRSLGEVGPIFQHLAFSFLIALSLITIYYLLITPVASAQTPNQYTTPNTNPNVPNNLHTWTQNVMIEVMAAATCQLAGIDPVNPNQKCLGVDPKTNSIGFVDSSTGSGQAGGAIGLMGNLIALTYTPPLRTGDYFSYLAQNFGIAKPAYAQAQGIGFKGLEPLMGLWIAFRNIVYLAFVLVFVVIGVAIMLRVKIDPRTVMTIENQIPKIIVGLLLVTFSFAIAGFLIDAMWVSIYLLINVILGVNPKIAADISAITQSTDPLAAANIAGGSGGNLGGLGAIVGAASDAISGMVSKLFDNPVGRGLIGFIGGIVGAVFGGKVASAFDSIPLVGSIIGFLAGAAIGATITTQLADFITKTIALLIIAIALLWALIRLWFELIKAYIFI